MTEQKPAPEPALHNDLLEGAEAISAFIFGDPGKRRKVYHLAQTSRLPVFRLGAILCGRKSRILEYIAEQERRSLTETDDD